MNERRESEAEQRLQISPDGTVGVHQQETRSSMSRLGDLGVDLADFGADAADQIERIAGPASDMVGSLTRSVANSVWGFCTGFTRKRKD